MKIEQAVAKAKRKLAENRHQETLKTLPADRQAAGGQGDWAPPVYNHSAYWELDKRILDDNRCVCYQEEALELDYYKMLRTQLIQNARGRGWNTFMVTSARPGEGKTLTSINLAMTFAKSYDNTVLLVDCDLRQQKVYRYLGINSSKGIMDHLAGDVPLDDIIVWPKVDKLTLISGGRTVNESAELLGSPRMQAMISEMKARYADRYILIDAPPILSGSDALILSTLVDGIVMVVESGKTCIKEIREALSLMPKEKFVGFVLNRHHPENSRYYNYYKASGRQ